MHPGNFGVINGEVGIIAICLMIAIIVGVAVYAGLSE